MSGTKEVGSDKIHGGRMELERDLVEKLAQAAHEVFCDSLKARGYVYGRETRDEEKTHSSLRPYAELTEEEKEQNRGFVREISDKLALVGYAMLPARAGEGPVALTEAEIERLAEAEHERWMRQKLDSGWRYGTSTDKARKLHRYLVPWDELPPGERDKDRVMVAGIPRILAKAGYTISKSGP